MTAPRQSYNPYKLINEVVELLGSHGVVAKVPPGASGEALGGAGMLLRGLGVEPLMDALDSFERTGSRIWSEEDGLQ